MDVLLYQGADDPHIGCFKYSDHIIGAGDQIGALHTLDTSELVRHGPGSACHNYDKNNCFGCRSAPPWCPAGGLICAQLYGCESKVSIQIWVTIGGRLYPYGPFFTLVFGWVPAEDQVLRVSSRNCCNVSITSRSRVSTTADSP